MLLSAAFQQFLNAISKTSAQVQARAVVKQHRVISVEERAQFFNAVETDECGSANAQETTRRHLFFEPSQSLTQVMSLRLGMQPDVISVRFKQEGMMPCELAGWARCRTLPKLMILMRDFKTLETTQEIAGGKLNADDNQGLTLDRQYSRERPPLKADGTCRFKQWLPCPFRLSQDHSPFK